MSIDQIAARIGAAPVNARGRRSYSSVLRREIMAAYAASGLTKEAFAEKVGVPSANLSNWRKLAPKREPRRSTGLFRAVAVEPDASSSASATLSLRVPGGAVIEGLSIATAAELIAVLSGRPPC